MKKEADYQGWDNYETWVVVLWLDNEEGTYNLMREYAEEARGEGGVEDEFGVSREATGLLADMIKAFVEESAPDLGASLYSDLLSAAMSEVNYYEIAEHYLEE